MTPKQPAGWAVRTGHDDNGRHIAEFFTPTGARHHSQAPPLPGRIGFEYSEVEARLSIDVTEYKHAA